MSGAPSRRRVVVGLAVGAGAAVAGALGCGRGRGARTTRSPAGDLADLDLAAAAHAVRTRAVSPVELTRACLARIERLQPRLNAFITVTAERALADARTAERELAAGRWRGPLHGIPVALKDNIDTAGIRTTSGSAVDAARVPAEDAEVVVRLRQAGAISLGKLNLHEFGIGATSAISHFGPVHNPWALERMTGGSSGGPAAAVAAGLCFGALGTDTGGSIRIPAAHCGIVGFKPSYGVVSARGVIPMATSLDHVGPMARTVADAALLLAAMTADPVAAACDPALPHPVSRLRVGVLASAGHPLLCDRGAEPEVQAVVDAAHAVLRSLVASMGAAELPIEGELGAIVDAESYRVHATRLAATPAPYDPRTREALRAGQAISDAALDRLRAGLATYRASIHRAFAAVDLMVVPTNLEPPLRLADAIDPFAGAACTFAFNLGGLPTISVPCGFTRSGLPLGLQIVGPPRADAQVVALALAYQRATDWHRRRPPLAVG